VVDQPATVLPLPAAAALLRLPPAAVEALVGSGYLVPRSTGPEGPEFRLADLKAFVARNADESIRDSPVDLGGSLEDFDQVDPQDLLNALDGRAAEMARRVYDVFSTVFPDAARWGIREQARFIEQAKARFEAILAVTGQGAEVDEALAGDLEEVGARAARAGSPLPRLLVILRASRDLVVQTAVELAEEHGRHWGLSLSLLLTRVLPAMDRLTDALAQGYWEAILGREGDARVRYEHLVEHAPDGIFDLDPDGRIHFLNRRLASMLGQPADELVGRRLSEVLRPAPLPEPVAGVPPGAAPITSSDPAPRDPAPGIGPTARPDAPGADPASTLESLFLAAIDAARACASSSEDARPPGEGRWRRLRMAIVRPDGGRRVLAVEVVARCANREADGERGVIGFQGIVRDETGEEPPPR
jgi:PAS domain-containing protein